MTPTKTAGRHGAGGPVSKPVIADKPAPRQTCASSRPWPSAADESVYTATLDAATAARFAAAKAEIQGLREGGVARRGSVAIAVVLGCGLASALDAPAASTWLRSAATEDFVRLARRRNALCALSPAEADALRAHLAACAAPDPGAAQ